jgi:hypothetical protein
VQRTILYPFVEQASGLEELDEELASGTRASARQPDHYYHCNGRQFARGLYGLTGKKCLGKSINGEYVERVIWADIESFLRDPGEILERLRERLSLKGDEQQRRQKELEQFRDRLEDKTAERERMLGLFRRGRIDDATLDQHLDIINAETVGLQAEIDMAERALSVGDQTSQLKSAESLLAALRKRLGSPVSPELKTHLLHHVGGSYSFPAGCNFENGLVTRFLST